MKKIIAINSVLFGIVFVLTGCEQPVSQTQPTTPTPVKQQSATNQPVVTSSNWKVYQNTKHKYTFSYPADEFDLSEFSKADSQDAAIISKDSYLKANIDVGNSSVNDNTGKCFQGEIVKSLTVDGQNVEICQGDNKHADLYTLIPRGPKNTVDDDIFVEIIGNQNNKQQTQEFFEKFISTFKFTK